MRIHLAFPTLGLLLLACPDGQACSIPVFRYALERWQPSPYEMLIFHRGPLTDANRSALREIEKCGRGANLDITPVDLDRRVGAELTEVWAKHGNDKTLPHVIVRYPDADAKTPLAWSGPLDLAALKLLIDSPFRQRIVRQLFNGNSAVFIMLESDDKAANAATAQMLSETLVTLEKTVEMPALSKEGPQLRSELPLRIAFPMLRLARNDPSEQALIGLLMHCEDGLDKAQGPIVFTLFGRGRVLSALHGKQLKAAEIENVARFLCGACSCEVKELNPGIDLIINAPWNAILDIEIAPWPREVNPTLLIEKR